jgi:hypothetical protein
LIFSICSGITSTISAAARAGNPKGSQYAMKQVTRKELREVISTKGIEPALRLGRTGLTAKQKKFAEGLVLEGLTGADAYRNAYDTSAKPKRVGNAASALKQHEGIKREIEALELAKQVSTLHSAAALRSLVISTLTKTIIDEDTKPATRIQAAKILGQVTEVSAFTTRSEVTVVQDSGAIRSQILDQLKSMMLSSDDAVDVDASDLLTELVGSSADPTVPPPPEMENGTPRIAEHTIPLEQSEEFLDSLEQSAQFTEDPPLSEDLPTPQGDIFLEKGK